MLRSYYIRDYADYDFIGSEIQEVLPKITLIGLVRC